jgi:hypothetical protein
VNDLKGIGFGDFERIPIEQVDLLTADLRRGGANATRPGGLAHGGMNRSLTRARAMAYQRTSASAPPAKTDIDPLLHRVVTARGGLDALTTVKRIVADGDTIVTTPDGKLSAKTKSYIEYPSRMRVEAQLPNAQIVQVYADGKAWVQDPGGVRDAPPDMLADFAASAKRDLVRLLVGAANGQLKVQALGEEGHEGQTLKVLGISGDGVPPVRLHIDPQSATVVKLTYDSRTPAPGDAGNAEPRPTEEIFSDYRVVDGVSIPFKATVKRGGMVLLERQLTNVQVNVPIDAAVFAKPLR